MKTAKLFLFMALIIFIVSCNDTFEEYSSGYYIPEGYRIYYDYYDSGFAGVSETKFNLTNRIDDEKKELSISNVMSLVSNFDFFEDGVKIDDDTICFLHEKMFFSQGIICFRDKTPVIFHLLETKGNHQKTESIWRLGDDTVYPRTDCTGDRSIFCSVFKDALDYSKNSCSSIEELQESCLAYKEIWLENNI